MPRAINSSVTEVALFPYNHSQCFRWNYVTSLSPEDYETRLKTDKVFYQSILRRIVDEQNADPFFLASHPQLGRTWEFLTANTAPWKTIKNYIKIYIATHSCLGIDVIRQKLMSKLGDAVLAGNYNVARALSSIIKEAGWPQETINENLPEGALLHETLPVRRFWDDRPTWHKFFKLLIDTGWPIDEPDENNQTLLHKAAKECALRLVNFLIERGADVTFRDQHGNTPLHLIVKYRPDAYYDDEAIKDTVKSLIKKNPAVVEMRNRFDQTPLMLACALHSRAAFHALIENGANVNVLYPRTHETLLHTAAKKHYIDFIETLVLRVDNIDQKDSKGLTPLHSLTASFRSLCDEEPKFEERCHNYITSLRTLLRYTSLGLDMGDHQGNTPLHYQCNTPDEIYPSHTETLKVTIKDAIAAFIASGAKTNLHNRKNLFPRDYLNNCSDEILEFVFEKIEKEQFFNPLDLKPQSFGMQTRTIDFTNCGLRLKKASEEQKLAFLEQSLAFHSPTLANWEQIKETIQSIEKLAQVWKSLQPELMIARLGLKKVEKTLLTPPFSQALKFLTEQRIAEAELYMARVKDEFESQRARILAEEEAGPPLNLCCLITKELMREPVIDRYGHTYERAVIEAHVSQFGISPLTAQPLTLSDLHPNETIGLLIVDYKNEQERIKQSKRPRDETGESPRKRHVSQSEAQE